MFPDYEIFGFLETWWPRVRCEGCYDFVYVPHDKTRARNVALAFVLSGCTLEFRVQGLGSHGVNAPEL